MKTPFSFVIFPTPLPTGDLKHGDLQSFPTRRSSDLTFDTLNLKAALFAIDKYFEDTGIRLPVIASITITDASGRTLSRSEEHTSELQSPCNLVCRLLLEKKNGDRKNKNSCCPRQWNG